jgi:hypothetical protein
MSKGSQQRPTDLKAYRDNWDKVFKNPVKSIVEEFEEWKKKTKLGIGLYPKITDRKS